MGLHPSGPRSVVLSAPELAVFLRTQVYPTHCGERLRGTQWTCEVSRTSRAWLAGANAREGIKFGAQHRKTLIFYVPKCACFGPATVLLHFVAPIHVRASCPKQDDDDEYGK